MSKYFEGRRKDGESLRDYFNRVFDYDRSTGTLYNKVDRGTRAKKGSVSGTKSITSKYSPEYLILCCDMKKKYYVHRVIWTMINGEIPNDMWIDHINGDGTDNRIENLRIVKPVLNCRNQKRPVNNTSGHIGVFKRKGTWCAAISKRIVGRFETFEEAVDARKEAERENGYHENHGRILEDA